MEFVKNKYIIRYVVSTGVAQEPWRDIFRLEFSPGLGFSIYFAVLAE
jgi:hypothetical protein